MLVLVCLLLAVYVLVSQYFKWSFQYWTRRHLPHLKPRVPFGNLPNPIARRRAACEVFKDLYFELKKLDGKHGGVYVMTNPMYVPMDLDLIRNIMTKDFVHFVDHVMYHNEKDDPLSAHIFALEGAKWRNLRVKMTPTFTSGELGCNVVSRKSG